MEQAKILIVDDTPYNLELLSKILEKQNHEVYCVSQGAIALEVAQSGWAELILLDIKMPEMDGYEVCRQLKAHPKTKDIPVIFLSALDDIADKVKAFGAGGVDYITKPFHSQEVFVRVNHQLSVKKNQQTINLINQQLEEKVQARTAELEIVNQKLNSEIQQRQQAQDKLLKLALHDPVTGLPNRNSFLGKLKQLLIRYQNQSEYHFAVILINCNEFSEIKCYFDHLSINQLLINLANRLQNCLPHSATLSRFEGNSFAIILEKITEGKEELLQWVEILQKEFDLAFKLTFSTAKNVEKAQAINISCSMGIVLRTDEYSAAYEMLQNAEIAAYQAYKKKLNYYFFTKQALKQQSLVSPITEPSLADTNVIAQLKSHFKEAVQRAKIKLYYQPILDLQAQKKQLDIKGIEVLNNQQGNYRKLAVLTSFFQNIEEYKFNIHLSNFILEHGAYQIKELQHQHETQQNFFLAMQVTETLLLQSQFVEQIRQILTTTKLAGEFLHLDLVVNDSTIANPEIFAVIQELYQLGIKLNLDCVNLAYESIKKLSNFPFNNFKINQALVTQIHEENILGLIAKIINLAHTNKITVTAKGIETEEQLTYLQSIGCNYGQGNLFSKPLDKSTLETFLVWRL